MASKALLASSQPPGADQHVRVPVDHEGVPHPGDVQVWRDHELHEPREPKSL